MPLVKKVPVRIELSTPGEWVDVKNRLSSGDEAYIEAAGFQLNTSMNMSMSKEEMQGQDLDLKVDYAATKFAGLEVGIIAWSFTEEDGSPTPITPANIRDLEPEDYDILANKVNEIWQKPRTDDVRKNSSTDGSAPA